MKKVTILGEEVSVGFNLAVQIGFEEITSKSFADIDGSVRDSVALLTSAIITCNPESSITLDRLVHEASNSEILAANAALQSEIEAWMRIPATVEDHEDEVDSQDAADRGTGGDSPRP